MPIPAARGGAVNDAGTLTMVVLPAQAPRLGAALTDRTGRSGWCRSRSSPHAAGPRHDCGAPRNGGSLTRPSWRSSATGSINSSSGWQRWNGASHQIRPPETLAECGHPIRFPPGAPRRRCARQGPPAFALHGSGHLDQAAPHSLSTTRTIPLTAAMTNGPSRSPCQPNTTSNNSTELDNLYAVGSQADSATNRS